MNTEIRQDLTVVLCTYNGERFVGQQLRSILNQSVMPAAVHVADDGSTDATLSVLAREWEQRPARASEVRLVLLEASAGLGPARNFERVLGGASTELIALSDQDDVWLPDRLARCLAVIDAHPGCSLVGSDAALIDASGVSLGETVFGSMQLDDAERELLRSGNLLPVLLRRNVVPGMTLLLRRGLLEAALPIPEGWIHDYWLLLLAVASDSLIVLDEPLVLYRMHSDNALGIKRGRDSRLSSPARMVARLRDPLAEPGKWISLQARVDRLDRIGAASRDSIARRVEFEISRRYGQGSLLSRIRVAHQLYRNGTYEKYSLDKRHQAWRDFLRRPSS